LATSSNLVGAGTVASRLTGELGSVIEANGPLALGDGSSPAGFNFAGELRTRQFAVTLNSSAAVGLGNLTTLGSGASPGTLNAANGFVVDFDEAVTGFGTINSINTIAKRATINGTVQGNSVAQPITLSGYIKGTGSFTNVNFAGTYSPGLSSTIVTAGNLAFDSANTLILELGGTTPGSGHDQIQASGLFAVGGTLQVELVNGFAPTSGQSFNLFDWASVAGTFSSLSLPTLSGLAWNTSQLYTNGILSVVSVDGIAGDYNNNGVVDAADYVVWRENVGTANLLPNDPSGGTIGSTQYNTWRSHFGQTAGSGTVLANLPEPANSWMCLAVLVSLIGSGLFFNRTTTLRDIWAKQSAKE
jgi:hypothetical protein